MGNSGQASAIHSAPQGSTASFWKLSGMGAPLGLKNGSIDARKGSTILLLSSPPLMLVSVPALILIAVISPATIAAPPSEFLTPRAPAIRANVGPDPNDPLWTPDSNIIPQPIRGAEGATIVGPQNVPVELQNPDILAPPTTDHGQVPNLKWPFALSHNRLSNGGWARQQNGRSLVNLVF